MKYFKNTELAKLYHVSEKSVRNWIDSAEAGKLDLQLHQEKGKSYIANVAKNTSFIEKLVERGKKFKNTRGFKVVTPKPKLYEMFTERQVFDIIANIEIYKEIPLKYSYFGEGAEAWDQYAHKLLEQEGTNSLRNTLQLLDESREYIEWMLEDFEKINIVDIGPGNGLPVRGLLEYLSSRNKLGRYITVDISTDMLDIANRNIVKWFDNKIELDGHAGDIAREGFDDLLLAHTTGNNEVATANVVLFLGGTISNFRDPRRALNNIHESMGRHDLFVVSKKLDTESSRRYFDFNVGPETHTLDLLDRMILDLLNIDESLYVVEQQFDKEEMARKIQVRLKVAVTIEFELRGQKRRVELNKDDTLLLWRARHQSAVETIEEVVNSGFELYHTAKSKDNDYFQLITKIKTEQ